MTNARIKSSSKKLTLLVLSSALAIGSLSWYKIHSVNTSPLSIVSASNQQPIDKSLAKNISVSKKISSSVPFLSNTAIRNEEVQTVEPAWQMGELANESIEIPELALENTTQIIQLNENFMEQEHLTVQLPNGQNLNIKKSNTVEYASGSKSWTGFDPNQPELFVAITKKDNSIAGSIETLDGNYELTSLKDGTQIIYQLDRKKVDQLRDGHQHVHPTSKTSTVTEAADEIVDADEVSNSTSVATNSIAVSTAADVNVSEITIMFVYTRAAVNAKGLNTLIAATENEITVSNTNTFPNSKVNIRLTPVHHVIYEFAENTSFVETVKDIGNSTKLNTEALRDKYSADLVQSVITNSGYGGYAWVMSSGSTGDSFKRSAYSAVNIDSIGYSMAHEIGHNLGLNHNKENANALSGFTDSFGFRYCDPGRYRTIMSYACKGAGRIKRYSNPNVTHDGLPTGVLGKANNARVLEEITRFRAESFRTGPVPTPTPSPTPTPTPKPTVAPTVAPTATPAPTLAPTPKPTATPIPTVVPTATPTPTIVPQPTATPAPVIIASGKQYRITAKHSGKALSVYEASIENFAPIVQYNDMDAANQKWTVIDKGNGYWKLQVSNSGKCLNVVRDSLENGGLLNQKTCRQQDKQQFKIKSLNNGFFNIIGKNSNKCINVKDSSLENNAVVQQWDCNGQENAKWKFEAIN